MNEKVTGVVVAVLVVAAIIVAVYTFSPDMQGSGKVHEVPVSGFSSGSANLFTSNGKAYLAVWSMDTQSFYLVHLNGTEKNVDVSTQKPVWKSSERLGPFADVACAGSTLYVAISRVWNGTETVLLKIDVGRGTVESVIHISGRSTSAVYVENGNVYISDVADNVTHIDRVFDNGSVETLYTFPRYVFPDQVTMFCHNGTLYYASSLLLNGTRSYEIIAINGSGARVLWKYSNAPGFGHAFLVDSKIYAYILTKNDNSHTFLNIIDLNGTVEHSYKIPLMYVVYHSASGLFVGGVKSIAYSHDGLHFTTAYLFHGNLQPIWLSQEHAAAVSGKWIYTLALREVDNEEGYALVEMNMEGVYGF